MRFNKETSEYLMFDHADVIVINNYTHSEDLIETISIIIITGHKIKSVQAFHFSK